MHVRRTLLAAAATVLLLAGCADDAGREPTAGEPVLPGTGEDFVGARQDVGAVDCRRDGATWRASGTVTNPADAPADYRIYVSFVDATGSTVALRQVDVPATEPGEPTQWEGSAELDGDGLQCVLRVERVL